jgi:hypothetical protein
VLQAMQEGAAMTRATRREWIATLCIAAVLAVWLVVAL